MDCLHLMDAEIAMYIDPEYEIYDVPPLEKYWLGEEEIREHKDRLQETLVRVVSRRSRLLIRK